MANVQHAVDTSLFAERPDSGWNGRCDPSAALWILFAQRRSYRLRRRRKRYRRSIRLCVGTLAEHAESGEERFTVEWNRSQDEVWYDILAFSRPQKMLARVGYPLSRMLQKRFTEGSKAAMLRAASAK